ncbi:CRE-CUT-6 protein [Caenorhabditis remanei]|uniref:CRE-CUT-6 protein n=1 Tax=Caenorhabditis remanei TaxID=31234 RepID=E3LYF6_CAERE|nr:CRE-CUT-6 protein [Caenorhabditis remanei]
MRPIPRYDIIISIITFLTLIQTNSANPIDNGLVDSELIHECVTHKAVEVILLLDASGSIGDDTFKKQLSFAMHLASRLNISEEGSHMALIQYAETPKLEFSLGQFNHPTQLEWAIQRIEYQSGATNTGQALRLTLEKGLQGARPGIPKVAIVITDGQSQDDVSEPSQLLRDADVMVYAIGVTNLVNVHQLHQMTGNPVRVFTVETFEQLDRALADSLTWSMCKTEFRPGTPEIICGPDRIGVKASTKQPFEGNVFVMDHYHDEECRAGPEKFPDSRSIGLTVPFSACNVHRYRSLNPKGIFVEVSIVFMFHSLFMTKTDQTVKVQCFYMEADKHVTVPLSVSMITTVFREQIYQMPQCAYTLRKGAPDGPIVRFATLGESVYHRWECIEVEGADKDTFGMLVHSCYVDNGYGDRVDILDSNGCGLDAVLLSTPDYDTSLRLATKPYHVFKYADRPVLQFQCQITLCLKYDGGCEGITPPQNCKKLPGEDGNHHHHHHDHSERRRKLVRRLADGVGTIDVFTDSVTVLEQEPACQQPLPYPITNTNIWIMATITLINIFVFIVTVWFTFRKRRCKPS